MHNTYIGFQQVFHKPISQEKNKGEYVDDLNESDSFNAVSDV